MIQSLRKSLVMNCLKKYWGYATFLLSGIVFLAFSIRFGKGVRGSDQYWYVSDVLLGQLTGRPRSNAIYPSALESNLFSPESLPPPIHSVPATYLANYMNHVVQDPYMSWLYLGLVLAISSAFLVYKISVIFVSSNLALLASALFLLTPQNLWLTLNPLMEQSVVFATLLLMYSSVATPQKFVHLGFMIVGTSILVASRPNYLLIAVGVLAIMYLNRRQVKFSALRAAIYLLGSGALTYALGSALGHYPTHGITGALASNSPSAEPGVGNMGGFFSPPQVPPLADILTKGINNISSALFPSSVADILLSLAPILLLIIGTLLLRRTKLNASLIVWSFTLLLVFFFTVFFFQFQSRYAAPLVPLTIIIWVVLLYQRDLTSKNTRSKFQRPLLITSTFMLILFLASSSTLIGGYYQTSERVSQERISLLSAELESEYGESTIFVTTDIALQTEIGYSTIPSAAIFTLPNGGSSCVSRELITRWNVQKVVVDFSEELPPEERIFCEGSQVPIRWDQVISLPGIDSSLGSGQRLKVGWVGDAIQD